MPKMFVQMPQNLNFSFFVVILSKYLVLCFEMWQSSFVLTYKLPALFLKINYVQIKLNQIMSKLNQISYVQIFQKGATKTSKFSYNCSN